MMFVIKNTIHNSEAKYDNCFKTIATRGLTPFYLQAKPLI
ncbi:Uncharacterised protein [Hafnia alvei]|jgi:hypothetical protein|nr:Uncharacterised protein [Hafnia alvei]